MTPSLDTTHRRAGGPPLKALIYALMVLPLLLGGLILHAEYRHVEEARRAADRVRAGVEETVVLDELRLAVVDEMSWYTTLYGAEYLNVPLAMVNRLMDVDVEQEYADAVRHTDELLADPHGTPFATRVGNARSTDFLDERATNRHYDGAVRVIGERRADVQRDLERASASVDGGESVQHGSQILEAAAAAEHGHVRQLWRYLAAEFGTLLQRPGNYVDVVAHRETTADALRRLERLVEPGTTVDAGVRAVRNSTHLRAFDVVIDVALSNVFWSATRGASDADPAVLALRLADFYDDGVRARAVFGQLSMVAGWQLDAAASELVAEAESDLRSTAALVAALGVLSIVGVWLLARFIGRPILRLAELADHLGDERPLAAERHGPREVRQVELALQHASESLVRLERLEHDATHDELTGLPSRGAVRRHLEHALARSARSGDLGAVMFADVDLFKSINDTYGHAAGDVVLCEVAHRLTAPLRETDLVGRYGGDEFVVVAEAVGSPAEAERLAQRLLADVRRSLDVTGASDHPEAGDVAVSVSIGLATFGPADGSIDAVIARADAATYEAKTRGRDRAVSAWADGGELAVSLPPVPRIDGIPIVDVTVSDPAGRKPEPV